MNKEQLRKIYKERRLSLHAVEIEKLQDLALIQFQRLDIQIPTTIMSYAAMMRHNEFNPEIITNYCLFKNPNQILLYPVIDKVADEMHAVAVQENTAFKLSGFGVAEPVGATTVFPQEIDLAIVPLLCFDKRGYRVGYGKGYYDRFLQLCRPDMLKIGVSFFEAEEEIGGIAAHDVRLNICITPYKTYSFS